MPKKQKFKISMGWYRIDELSDGEYVKRSIVSKKVYIRGEYYRDEKKYALHDTDDISKWVLVNGSTKVWAGFMY